MLFRRNLKYAGRHELACILPREISARVLFATAIPYSEQTASPKLSCKRLIACILHPAAVMTMLDNTAMMNREVFSGVRILEAPHFWPTYRDARNQNVSGPLRLIGNRRPRHCGAKEARGHTNIRWAKSRIQIGVARC